MAQFTRGQLKSLVKECLVEILSEGLAKGDSHLIDPGPIQERRSPAPRSPSPPRSSSPALNSVVFGSSQPPQKKVPTSNMGPGKRQIPDSNRETASAIKSHISTITSDPVMSQIFADTAASTLQEQFHADRGQGRADVSSELVSDPLTDDFLSESAKNWSALAFPDSPKSR